ncbi:MAG TPA: hypothetical protein VKA15_26630, partial [Isosphaeraceae bacterium]|nr:hypothetical protein [Isosphaeraceae bacterium]
AAVGGAGGVGAGGGASSTGCDGAPAPAPDGAVAAPARPGPADSVGGRPLYDPGIIEKSGPYAGAGKSSQ